MCGWYAEHNLHIGKLLSSCETPPISSENDTGTGWYCRPGGRAQPGVAAPSGRPTDRAADLNSNSWPHLKSSPFYLLGSTARVFGVIAPKHACSSVAVAVSAVASWWWLLPAAAAAWCAAYRSLPASVAAAWRRRRVDLFFFPVAAGTSLFLAS